LVPLKSKKGSNSSAPHLSYSLKMPFMLLPKKKVSWWLDIIGKILSSHFGANTLFLAKKQHFLVKMLLFWVL